MSKREANRRARQRVHNEYFRTVSKRTCPSCGARGVRVWSWGEYVVGKWRNVTQFCDDCVDVYVSHRLLDHAADCGCTFRLIGYGGQKLSLALERIQTVIDRARAVKEVA